MKKHFFGLTACIVISLFFISCPNDPAGPSGNDEPDPIIPGEKTLIVFDNTYGICTVLVYDDYRRRDMDRIVEIPTGQCSDEFEWTPSTSTPFYFAYRVSLKGVSGFTVDFVPEVGKDQKAVRIDAGTRTVIPIPALDEAVSSQEQALSRKSYLTVLNSSEYSFQLHRGVSMIRPDNSPDSGVVSIGQRAPYTTNPGRSSDYRLLVAADYMPLPESPERFEAGNFYSYIFTSDVSLDVQMPINLDNIDIKTYTVNFDSNGGSGTIPPAQNVRAASGITLPLGNELGKGDEIFGGWSVDEFGTGVVYSAGTRYTVTGDITLYAKWYPAGTTLYTVTFDSAGGNETASQSMVSGAVAIRPADPYRANYTFDGWYRDAGAQTPYNFATPVREDFTLYAKWIANRYTVTFNANGADGAAPAAVTVDYGSGITLPGADGLSKPYATFDGWNTEDDGTGTAYASGAQYTVTADVTLFAVWESPVYTVTFDSAGGSETASQSIVAGAVAIRPADPYRANYTFDGWYSDVGAQTPYNFATPVTEDFTLYAKWIANKYTVTFNANGADGAAPAAVTVDYGVSITLPGADGLTKPDEIFNGWNTEDDGTGTSYASGEQYTVTADVTLFAMWKEDGETFTVSTPAEFDSALTAIQNSTDTKFIIIFTADMSLGPNNLSGLAYDSKTITLRGNTPARTISLSSQGSLFTVGAYVELILKDIILLGRSGNNASLITVNTNGNLVLNSGEISGNTVTNTSSSSRYGGGVYVYDSAAFTMSGGIISGNTAYYGGGVYASGGTFTMISGEISGNTASASDGGGGVYVSNGTFTMYGGDISGNRGGGVLTIGIFTMYSGKISGNTASRGGGVYVSGRGVNGVWFDGTFTMTGGEISDNTASSFYGGGGVYNDGNFTMNGGEISGNTASDGSGGGVYNNRIFTMYNGEISGNTTSSGGGVYVNRGTFTMTGGKISGNTASRGGGVYYFNAGTICIVTGTVYGLNEGALSNAADEGAAFYLEEGFNTTGTAQYGTFSGETWNSNGDLITTDNTIRAVNGWVNYIGVITAPTWYTGEPVSLDAPYVHHIPGTTITAQGWQTGDNSGGGWTNFTPSIGDTVYNRKYLRYYAVISDGQTLYSNTVQITVISSTTREVSVEMWDSTGTPWIGNCALRINVNGTDLSTNAKKTDIGRIPVFYTFFVDPGDEVIFYWIAGRYQEENAFAVYYTNDPPNPAFDPTRGADVDTDRILLYRQYLGMASAADGAVLGSFTVTE